MGYAISELPLGAGLLGIAPMPGRSGRYRADLSDLLEWGAGLVLTMTTAEELARSDAHDLGTDLAEAGVLWRHLPVGDFGVPTVDVASHWPAVAHEANSILSNGGKVLAHCYGGCGRSGMALLALMVGAGEEPGPALLRLRAVRPCAVETDAQFDWAAGR